MTSREDLLAKWFDFEKSDEKVLALYGRKGVGKTSFLKGYISGKKHVWFTAYPMTGDLELRMMARTLLGGAKAAEKVDTTEKLFSKIKEVAGQEEFYVIIDQYNAFASADSSFNKDLAEACSSTFADTKIRFVLILDSYLQAEKLLLNSKCPWKKHTPYTIEETPRRFEQIRGFYPDLSTEDQVLLYGMTGGIPALLEMTKGMSVKEACQKIFLSVEGRSYLAEGVMEQDLREFSYYNRMLYVLSEGLQRVNEISAEVGKPKDVVVPYMNTLISLGLVQKETPITEKTNRRKTRYSMVNHADEFWYLFFVPRFDLTEKGDIEEIWNEVIEPKLDVYMQRVFKDVCREYLEDRSVEGKLPCNLDEIGNWWENDDEKKTTQGFDLVGLGQLENEEATAFCRCYYGKDPIEISELKAQIELAKHMKQKGASFYVIFSKAGFHENAVTVASAIKNIVLLTMEDLV